MEARVKSLVLPEAPKYEGNTGSVWTRPWYATEKDLTVVIVSPRQGALPKKQFRRRKPGRPHTGGRGPAATEEEIKQIMALHSAGVPRKEIAARTRRPYSTINKWIRALEEKA